ncbi:hypothetical protein FHS04_000782 [Mesoflavibacter sabulilitoris]|nr:hypothetical protein [Mesoflavibacter zeaxanthinifaciens]MBB3123285.1 hypothetical protein [Mesoflavibacter zeaxanthinifaciens subsp. sabulilitoris]
MSTEQLYLKGNEEHWICICGNDTMDLGFQTCDKKGNFIEPTTHSLWQGHYACQNCGRIIEDSDTRKIVEQNPFALRYDDYLKSLKK